jgi:hypothetical protein
MPSKNPPPQGGVAKPPDPMTIALMPAMISEKSSTMGPPTADVVDLIDLIGVCVNVVNGVKHYRQQRQQCQCCPLSTQSILSTPSMPSKNPPPQGGVAMLTKQRPPTADAWGLDGIDLIDGVDGIDCGPY